MAMPHLRLVYTQTYSIIATISSPMIVPMRLSTMGMEKVHPSEYVAIGEKLADRPEMDGRFEQNNSLFIHRSVVEGVVNGFDDHRGNPSA